MNILHINTSDDGGAAQAAVRLHMGLIQKGIKSEFLCLSGNKKEFEGRKIFVKQPYSFVDRVLYKLGLKKKANENRKEILAGRPDKFDIFTFSESEFDITETPEYKRADIIHLNWVAMFLDYPSFFKKNKKPVVWTFHDQNAFTGGCHYTSGCYKFQSECIACHQLEGTENPNYSKRILVSKIAAISNFEALTIVTPSKWLGKSSQSSLVMKGKKHHVIQYGLDTAIFKVRDKKTAREMLNLPQDKKIVLFVSQFLTNERKGFKFLAGALKLIEDDNLFLCSVGAKVNMIEGIENHLNLGTIKEEEKMSWIYAAADVFVIPSLEDNLPNTVIESLMCGVPVVGFSIGGVEEMVDDGENGYLCNEISADSLKEGILKTINKKNQFERKEIAKNALKKYDINIMSENYLKLFKRILAEGNN